MRGGVGVDKEEYDKARSRVIDSVHDLDTTIIRRIAKYLLDHTYEDTARRYNVPRHVIREIVTRGRK